MLDDNLLLYGPQIVMYYLYAYDAVKSGIKQLNDALFRAKPGKTDSEMKSSGVTQWSSQSSHMSHRNAYRGMAM